MDAETCLKKIKLVDVLNVATVDENVAPQIHRLRKMSESLSAELH